MHAVFFMSECLRPTGVEDQTIHLFENEGAARDFVFDKLVETGQIQKSDDGSLLMVGDERCDTADDAISAVQEGMGIVEFFHVYPVVNHCEAIYEGDVRR